MQILSRPSLPAVPELEPELEPGLSCSARQACGHLSRPRADAVDVGADQRGRDEPEGRERRVAAADRRLAVEDRVEASLLRERLELGTGIGDDGELLGVLARPSSQKCSRCERVSSVVPDLEEATKKVRPTSIDSCRRRIALGCVVSRTWKLARLEAASEDLRREARSAHPEQDVVLVLADRGGGQVELPERLVQPTEPLILVRAGPDGGVARPDPLDEPLPVAHAETSSPRLELIPSSSSANESENFSTPSFSSTALTSS